MRPVAPLSAFGRADLASAGGKGANLGELIRAGFPVPDGFVITTDAYAVIAEGRTDASYFATVTLPGRIRTAILEALARLGGGPVAVRSSATAEDLPGAAFAGQQDTYLNVVGEEAVLDAVRRCWGSLWTERAIAYRRRLGIDPAEVRIAVVVQRMVEAEIAGVMFTANPVTGERTEIVVDASSGLGEAVVSGLVTPDHYVLDPQGRVKDWSQGRHEVVVRSTAGGGVTHDQGDGERNRRLSTDELGELAGLGRRVAAHFGRPQDIEWAYVGGRPCLLQARPMTALPPPPVRLGHVQRRLGAVLLDYVPTRPYPIDMTTWVPYGPLGMMVEVAKSVGVRGLFEGALQEEDGVVYRLVPQPPRPTLRLLAAPFRLGWKAHRHDPARWEEDPRFAGFLRRARELAAVDLATLPWPELIRMPRRALDLVTSITGLRIDYLPRAGLAMLRLLLVLRRLGRTSLMPDLILGAPTRTEAANRALAGLAALVREEPELKAAVDRLDAEPMMRLPAFREFLVEYGHRETVSPILVSPPTWEESPETVLGLIKMLASTPPSPRSSDRAAQAMARLFADPRLRNGTRRDRMAHMVAAARVGVAFREDSHFFLTKPLPILRRSLLEIGRRLCESGVLAGPLEVFHLRFTELEEIDDPARLTESQVVRLRAAVRARSAKREELSGVRLIDPHLIFPKNGTGSDALVSGTPGGGGSVTGPVRIIRDSAQFADLLSGEVLVCPYTNPSWTPLFQRAVAVVVDSGGIASHAAIVAREYGIPAVMGTATGTADLTDGQMVTVDGDTGLVTAADS